MSKSGRSLRSDVCFGVTAGGKVELAKQGWGPQPVSNREQVQLDEPKCGRPELICRPSGSGAQLPENRTLLARSEFCPMTAYCIGD